MQQTRDLQLETMRLYRAFMGRREDWGGKLVLLSEAGCAQTGAPAAVSIAGGTSLALGSDAAAMKAALRAGYLDFVVNSLDEALRALKNEVRQRRPLSVGLVANVDRTLAEMDERGIAPDLRPGPALSGDQRGAEEQFFPAPDAAALRAVDAALLDALPADGRVRRRWIERAPQFLREARSGGRWIWLSEAEFVQLAAQDIKPAPRS